jgi:hypothetical protein
MDSTKADIGFPVSDLVVAPVANQFPRELVFSKSKESVWVVGMGEGSVESSPFCPISLSTAKKPSSPLRQCRYRLVWIPSLVQELEERWSHEIHCKWDYCSVGARFGGETCPQSTCA